jgi:hypothetical protein
MIRELVELVSLDSSAGKLYEQQVDHMPLYCKIVFNGIVLVYCAKQAYKNYRFNKQAEKNMCQLKEIAKHYKN